MIIVLWSTVWGFMFSAYKFIPGFEALYESGFGIIIVIILFVIFFISGLVGIFIGGGIIHLGVLLFGGKRGYSETVKALVYGGTPAYLFGWIPFLTIIFAIWALILEIFGIRELQDLSTGRAVAAMLVPIIIIFVILTVIIAISVYVYVSGMIGGTIPKTSGLL